MVATLNEAFKGPSINSSSYTSSSLDSIKNNMDITNNNTYVNPYYNGNMGIVEGVPPSNPAKYPKNNVAVTDETTYKIDIPNTAHEDKCSGSIYHILSCTKCRNKLKKLLQDDDVEEGFVANYPYQIKDRDTESLIDINKKQEKPTNIIDTIFEGKNISSLVNSLIYGIILIMIVNFLIKVASKMLQL